MKYIFYVKMIYHNWISRELTEAEIEAETQRLRADMAARLPEIEEIRRQRERVMQQRRERENQ